MIGATTRVGMLAFAAARPVRHGLPLEFYTAEELRKYTAARGAGLRIEIERDGAYEIAKRSRGTPRITNRLLRRVRDFAQVRRGGSARQMAREALDNLGIDEFGLDKVDRKYLKTIIEKYAGGPVGVETLSAGSPKRWIR